MNKKGFTLIELLAIIIIIGAITTIAIVSITNSINKSKWNKSIFKCNDSCKIFFKNISRNSKI